MHSQVYQDMIRPADNVMLVMLDGLASPDIVLSDLRFLSLQGHLSGLDCVDQICRTTRGSSVDWMNYHPLCSGRGHQNSQNYCLPHFGHASFVDGDLPARSHLCVKYSECFQIKVLFNWNYQHYIPLLSTRDCKV